jgi:murein DD-endopeptidase MepM/ murein hydrolase activator NlpD
VRGHAQKSPIRLPGSCGWSTGRRGWRRCPTGKELDEETGLYYYGARYLNPRTSRWISADPGLETYLPVAPVDEEARKKNQDLPGMGGVFNPVNLTVYHYTSNNPLKYVDPKGEQSTSYMTFLQVFTSHPEDYAKLQAIEMNPIPIPLRHRPEVTSGFGMRVNPFTGLQTFHRGTDISTPRPENIPVLAAITGTVTQVVSNDPVYGNYVVVQSSVDPNLTTLYGHLETIDVTEGAFVGRNVSTLGIMGSTGTSTGPHLHFEVQYKGVAIDPLLLKVADPDTFVY